MKKITIFLIFIISLMFNNIASAGIFAGINWAFQGSDFRCSIVYSRDNLTNTQLETKKNTTQFVETYFYKKYNYCDEGAKNLAKKIKKWLKKDPNNILLNFDEPLRCKEGWGLFSIKWAQIYTPCAAKYNQQLLDLLTDKYPAQIKTTHIKKQLYEDASSGVDENSYKRRCMAKYTRLNLMTGSETIHKNTVQFRDKEYCQEGAEKLAQKLIKWTNKTRTNIVVNIDKVRCRINNYVENAMLGSIDWGKYADCPEEYSQQLADYLVTEIPTQIGNKVRSYEFKPTLYD